MSVPLFLWLSSMVISRVFKKRIGEMIIGERRGKRGMEGDRR